MYRDNDTLIYSPSDLCRFIDSPFAAWMERLIVENPGCGIEPDGSDPLFTVLEHRGREHEAACFHALMDSGRRITVISQAQTFAEQLAQTKAAMEGGADVIYQAALQKRPFRGYADFLVRVDGASALGNYHYTVWDAKLSGTVKPSHLIQLCAYADMLTVWQKRLPECVSVAPGSGEPQSFPIGECFHYYQAQKAQFLSAEANFCVDAMPDPADSFSWGRWVGYAESVLEQQDHLSRIANITRAQVNKLQAAGIYTLSALADSSLSRVSGIADGVLLRLQAQARIQRASEGCETPKFEILFPPANQPLGLALLPPASPLDVFFDIEGFPLEEGGLEYLWGATYFDDHNVRCFRDFWAHDAEQEKRAFEGFIRWVYERWQRDPRMHIYHYANYEIAACRRLMGRYGVCEHEVDQLLRNEVFVDLYKIVRHGLLLGERNYSIKSVEHLYRSKRQTEVGTGGDSVVVYEQWRQRRDGDTWQTSQILNSIRDYNIDDCDSTQELVDWLREEQRAHAIAYVGTSELLEVEPSEEVTERTQRRDRLLAQAEQQREDEGQLDTETAESIVAPVVPQSVVTETLAWLLEFHRREAKPVFWRLFDRLGLSDEELVDDIDCLALCERTERPPFKPKPNARKQAYEYRFDPRQEFKGAAKTFYLAGEESEKGKPVRVNYEKSASDLQAGLIVISSTQEPPNTVTLIPDEYVNPGPIESALDRQIAAYERGEWSECAIGDFLTRAMPRIAGHTSGAQIVNDKSSVSPLAQIIQAVSNLQNSYLTIQGPPGAGKTYTGKHVISELVRQGRTVGICSNSHKAINNLLIGTAEYCRKQGVEASFACTKNTDPRLEQLEISVTTNNKLDSVIQPGAVIGTTAWGFAREELQGCFDYLFVDEAGQVSLANLVAISGAAKNLVLLGDQMQLGQPIQGSHPGLAGLSVLDYLLGEKETIDDSFGVFLGTTYRMHPAVNEVVSEAFYGGRLQADPDNARQVIEVPSDYGGLLDCEAGVVYLPVEHEGNTQASDEEVAAITINARELVGRTYYDKEGSIRELALADILFVAPYNHQVNKLQQALGSEARVGSVDKFQGQEAPVIFLSMCASDPEESSRGLAFLLDKHRLNVAISRAETLVVIVASPRLGLATARNLADMRRLNLWQLITRTH
ncbi:TM0106 family RecB-like putative nuclease [Microbulbifer guangxiensis]|uniref:TM0106 family RecB-like putative nuclease n=1 Tax=Microbulbifer guangxiensis TaxID=2904249 RepID=UPI001F1A6949|nr:TM0106 family RecB-like putative nuclease [Microbulbifer guangxiensis]